MTSQTTSISLQFGYDILPRAGKTFLYPFGGFRYFNWLIFGKSTTGVKLSADRSLLDFLAGFGLRQFLNDDLHGVFNNLDVNFGTSLSLANGKWQAVDDTDASFIQGKMKNRMTYFVTVTIGRAFRVAN